MAEMVPESEAEASGDIIFDCPHCGKSLAIDPRGAGLIIACPDCHQNVTVPGLPPDQQPEEKAAEDAAEAAVDAEESQEAVAGDPAGALEDPMGRIQQLSEALATSQAKIERLVASLEEVRERRRYLEKLRSDNMARFEDIGKDMVLIQDAVDRIVAILQDARAEKQAGEI